MIKRVVLAVVASSVLCGSAAGSGQTQTVPRFAHAIVIVFENKEYPNVLGGKAAPTFTAMSRRYALLSRYYGVAHPSLPNYLALVSGSTHGITDDCETCAVTAPSLADTLEAHGKTWKTYAEGLPRAGFKGAGAGRYVKRHDPLLYFTNVAGNPARLSRIVPLTRLAQDLRAGTLPDFSLVVPDLCNDMHDCPVATGDAWLRGFLRLLLPSTEMHDTAVFVIFDEGSSAKRGGGHVPAMVLGPLVRPQSVASARLNHYSVLRTIEDAWGLRHLGRSARAAPIVGIWR